MLLSIVTGTWNRLSSLQRMVQSVRDQMPRHLPYEFILVDGGSTDGTIEWCMRQTDIRFIQHGELRGAIKAFSDGARASQAEYVILGNDDVRFHPYSILRALSYLETHRTCGAVAFADDRYAQMTQGEQTYRVMGAPAINVDGSKGWAHYAQVGMFRRWLGERVGWWGDQDPVMGQARTYGADNWLSAGIWELGYSVDAVDGCRISDLIVYDALREHNGNRGDQDSKLYYRCYPNGPQLQPAPTIPNPQRERLRLLLMDIHERHLPARLAREAGLADSLARHGWTWEIDYVNELWDLVAAVEAWRPHLLLLQMHDTHQIDAALLSRARAAHPAMVVVNWNGDAHERGLTSPEILAALKYVDLQTVVNTKVAPIYEAAGIHWAYWQIAFKVPAMPYGGEVPAWDILFLGNCYNEERHQLVAALQQSGRKVGIYGNCPGTVGNTHYDFAQSWALYERCTIAVSDTYADTEGFVSNRLFQALAAGAFVLQQHSPRLDELTGLRAGEHYVEWNDLQDLKRKLRKWLAADRKSARRTIAEAGQAFVKANYSYEMQVRKLFDELLVRVA